MVLHHVSDAARLVVKLPSPLDAEGLGHRDLDALHVIAVPQRLEKGVGEAEDKQVFHRLLAEVMVDAKNRRLGEDAVQRRVERTGRGQVMTEGLLQNDARAGGAA